MRTIHVEVSDHVRRELETCSREDYDAWLRFEQVMLMGLVAASDSCPPPSHSLYERAWDRRADYWAN